MMDNDESQARSRAEDIALGVALQVAAEEARKAAAEEARKAAAEEARKAAAEEAERQRQQAAIDEQYAMMFAAAEANREENDRYQAQLAAEQAAREVAREVAEKGQIAAILADSPSLSVDDARAWLAIEAERAAEAARPCCPCRSHARREVVRAGPDLGRCTCPKHDGVAK